MKYIKGMLVVLAIVLSMTSFASIAGDTDPLFVNMTTDESHRASMALGFGKAQMERGHPLTIFLNDRGVLVGSRANASKYAEHQKTLTEAMSKGAAVIACPTCMKHYGVMETDLLPGIKLGEPKLTGGALFKDNTKTLTW
jgi:sulfur relay (sulfurtransferase) complex TusBCD TusD component (DsrE family)